MELIIRQIPALIKIRDKVPIKNQSALLYFTNGPDWEVMINTQQEINFKIIEIVKKHGIDFAFPTRSLYFENQPKS